MEFLNGYFDREFYLQVLTGIIVVPAGLGVAVLYTSLFDEKATDRVLWHLFWAGVIHSLIMLVAFSSEAVSSFLYNYIPLTEKGQGFVEMRIRSPGLTSGGGDILSGLHAVLVVVGFYMVLRSWRCLTMVQKIMACSGFYLLVASMALAARTGYVVTVLLIPVLFVVLKWCTQERFSFPYLLKGFTVFLFLGVFTFLSF
ncbi:hypothetical protein [Tamilnaduibacter salinus]|uniref:hypothetical protein n=1 Tax=Tamilnaduibacter salinus TaxID=1484056 RepID=UPI00117F533F|nr:hypothetical protein [Tamilnaduibacter salinus]